MEEHQKEPPKPRTRTRETDFHAIENPPQDTPLTPFQQKVREKLKVRPHSDTLIRQEELRKKKNAEIQIRRRVMRNQKYAGLTPKQQQALKLGYHRFSKDSKKRKKPVALAEIAKKLGITPSSVSSRMRRGKKKIEKLGIRQHEGQMIKKLIKAYIYRAKLRRVFHLYFERLWPPQQIADALHKSLASIYKNIRTLRWLAHAYSPKEAQRYETYSYKDEKNKVKKIGVSVKKPSQIPEKWPK